MNRSAIEDPRRLYTDTKFTLPVEVRDEHNNLRDLTGIEVTAILEMPDGTILTKTGTNRPDQTEGSSDRGISDIVVSAIDAGSTKGRVEMQVFVDSEPLETFAFRMDLKKS